LRFEFGGQCVYCRALDHAKGQESFGVDHYRPKRRFPLLSAEYLNLYYACNRCNSNKGQFWPNAAQQTAGIFIPNPCEHTMFDHMRYTLGRVESGSVAGSYTVDQLDLNDPDFVQFREGFIAALAKLATEEQAADLLMQDAAKAHKTAASAKDANEANNILTAATANRKKAKEEMRNLLGDLVYTALHP
jgi:hypothetical protein